MKRALSTLLILLTALSFTACGGMQAPRYEEEYHTPEELEELYSANKEAFNKVAKYFLESEEMLAAMRNAHEADRGIYGSFEYESKPFFTAEQWEEITALCDTVKPYMIMRCRKIDDIVYFVFPLYQERDTMLFYLPNATEEVLDFYGSYCCYWEDDEYSFYEIDDDWWILDVQHGETYKESETLHQGSLGT